jgi:hypothetical protein
MPLAGTTIIACSKKINSANVLFLVAIYSFHTSN